VENVKKNYEFLRGKKNWSVVDCAENGVHVIPNKEEL